MRSKRLCVLLLVLTILICACTSEQDDEGSNTTSRQERMEELWATYDEDFVTNLQQAQEEMGKTVMTYTPISDQFTIPKRIDISGSHHDLGLLIGHLARQYGWAPRRVTLVQGDLNNRIIDMYRRIYPPYLELARGVGNVFDIPMQELDLIYLEGEFFFIWQHIFSYSEFEAFGPGSTATGSPAQGHCAVVSANVEDTTLVGRNFDNDRERPHFVVYTDLSGVYRVMANAQYTIYHWVMDGINEKGLVMATANQASPPEYYSFMDPYPDFPVINEHHMFRVALETCATVDEVIALYQSVRPWCSDYADHLMVVDALGNSAVIGLGTDRNPDFFRSEKSYQVLTNTAYHMGHNYLINNCSRYATATRMAEEGIFVMDDVKNIMRTIRGPAFGYMSLYDIGRRFMRLYLRHDYNEPWDFILEL